MSCRSRRSPSRRTSACTRPQRRPPPPPRAREDVDLMGFLADTPIFWKGIVVVACALILFVGSVYVLLSAVFGLRMGYLVLAVSFFGWLVLLSLLWVLGQPKVFGVTGTLPNLGPRGTEPHWQVYASSTGTGSSTRFPTTSQYPGSPWHVPETVEKPSIASVTSAVQKY